MSEDRALALIEPSLDKNDLYDILIFSLKYIARNNTIIMSESILFCNSMLII